MVLLNIQNLCSLPFCILFYLHYSHSLLSQCFFIPLNLFNYVKILLFHWVYFTSFFDHYVEQNLFLFILKQALGYLLQNSCSKSVLNLLKYICESVSILIKASICRLAALRKLNFVTEKEQCGSIYFWDIIRIKLLAGNSALTKVNEWKNITVFKFTF